MLKDRNYDVIFGTPFTRFDSIPKVKLYLVHTLPEWKSFYKLLSQQSVVACDTETNGFYWAKGHKIIGMSFGWHDTHFYIPVRHEDSVTGGKQIEQLSMDDIRSDLQQFFGDPARTTIWHNMKFDRHMYLNDGIEIKTKYHDTTVLWHFYNEEAPKKLKVIASGWTDLMGIRHKGLVSADANSFEKIVSTWRSQEAVARRKLYNASIREKALELRKDLEFQGFNLTQLKRYVKENIILEVQECSKEDIHYGFVPAELMAEYAASDTYLTFEVYKFCQARNPLTDKQAYLYQNELKLSEVLFQAERYGMYVDTEYLRSLGEDFQRDIDLFTKRVLTTLGNINFSSGKQLSKALTELGVPLTNLIESQKEKIASGQDVPKEERIYKTDKSALSKYRKDFAVVDDLLRLKEVTKLKSTYVDGILDLVVDGNRVCGSFNQNVSTGRMSCRDPNLTNLPSRSEKGLQIKRSFITPPSGEYIYVLADYSQFEARLTAHLSDDPVLVDAYLSGQDVHTKTMCSMFNVPYHKAVEVLANPEHPEYKTYKANRAIGKTLNFAIIYGVGPTGLSEQLERPERYKDLSDEEWIEVCKEFIDLYFEKMHGIKKFINRAKRAAKAYGQVVTEMGRVRHLPAARATKVTGRQDLFWMEGKAQRQAANFLVQGWQADMFKVAIVRIYELLKDKKSVLVNFVHDEVQIYLHKDEIYLLDQIKHVMEDWKLRVPIVAEFSWSDKSWADKKDIL